MSIILMTLHLDMVIFVYLFLVKLAIDSTISQVIIVFDDKQNVQSEYQQILENLEESIITMNMADQSLQYFNSKGRKLMQQSVGNNEAENDLN